jgi:hypothetical protein
MNEKQAFKAGYLAASDMSGKPESYIKKIVDNAFKEWKKEFRRHNENDEQYQVKNEQYPKRFNESKGADVGGIYWDWDELHCYA